MRFVSWNCCGGPAGALAAVAEQGADASVLCEVPSTCPPSSLFDQEPSWAWDGQPGSKGLAVVGLTSPLVARPKLGAGRWSVATEHESGVGILGVWSCPAPGRSYGDEVQAVVEAHADWLVATPSIVAGDFNLAPGGAVDRRTGSVRTMFADFDELGYVSVYHHVTGDAYGAERSATYFHLRRQLEPFHIDFCFAHRTLLPAVRRFEVGDYERWVARRGVGPGHSDHVPLILDLEL